VQGSPNLFDRSNATYRLSLCATAARANAEGAHYLYTLALSCPQGLWDDLKDGFREAIESFELLTPGPDFVSPEQQPWRFF